MLATPDIIEHAAGQTRRVGTTPSAPNGAHKCVHKASTYGTLNSKHNVRLHTPTHVHTCKPIGNSLLGRANPTYNAPTSQMLRQGWTACFSFFTRVISRRCCILSCRRAFLASGPQRWQNWQAKPFSQPLLCTKAQGLQRPAA